LYPSYWGFSGEAPSGAGLGRQSAGISTPLLAIQPGATSAEAGGIGAEGGDADEDEDEHRRKAGEEDGRRGKEEDEDEESYAEGGRGCEGEEEEEELNGRGYLMASKYNLSA